MAIMQLNRERMHRDEMTGIANGTNVRLQVLLAARRDLPGEAMEALRKNKDVGVRSTLARNTDNVGIHRKIAEEELSNYNNSNERGEKDGSALVLMNLALNSNLGAGLRKEMTGATYPIGVRWTLAGVEDADLQFCLLRDEEWSVSNRVARESRIREVQLEIAKSADVSLLLSLSFNSHMAPEVFKILSTHSNFHVRRSTLGNLQAAEYYAESSSND